MFYIRLNSTKLRVFVTEDKSIPDTFAAPAPFNSSYEVLSEAFEDAVALQQEIDRLPKAPKWKLSADKRVANATEAKAKKPVVTYQDQSKWRERAKTEETKLYVCKCCKRKVSAPVITLIVEGVTLFDNSPHCSVCADSLKHQALDFIKNLRLKKLGGIQTVLNFG